MIFWCYKGRLLITMSSCLTLPNLEHGQLILKSNITSPFAPGTQIPYNCDPPYKWKNSIKFTCQDTGQWSSGGCVRQLITCGDPGYIENGHRRIGNVFTFPNSVKYLCDEGYVMKGLNKQYCSVSGNWEPQRKPTCEKVKCPKLDHPSNGRVNFLDRTFGSVASYQCAESFKLVNGDENTTCQANGSWSGMQPSCQLVTCKNPGSFRYGNVFGRVRLQEDYLVNEILIFQCQNPSVPSKTLKCLETGLWNTQPPICLPPKQPPTIETKPILSTDDEDDDDDEPPPSPETEKDEMDEHQTNTIYVGQYLSFTPSIILILVVVSFVLVMMLLFEKDKKQYDKIIGVKKYRI